MSPDRGAADGRLPIRDCCVGRCQGQPRSLRPPVRPRADEWSV